MTNKPRNRVVVFRLSQDEYSALKEACERVGARNLSDFARTGILGYLGADPPAGRFNERFASLEQRIATLQSQLNILLLGVPHASRSEC